MSSINSSFGNGQFFQLYQNFKNSKSEKDTEEALKNLNDSLDANNDGTISLKEISSVSENLSQIKDVQGKTGVLTAQDAASLFSQLISYNIQNIQDKNSDDDTANDIDINNFTDITGDGVTNSDDVKLIQKKLNSTTMTERDKKRYSQILIQSYNLTEDETLKSAYLSVIQNSLKNVFGVNFKLNDTKDALVCGKYSMDLSNGEVTYAVTSGDVVTNETIYTSPLSNKNERYSTTKDEEGNLKTSKCIDSKGNSVVYVNYAKNTMNINVNNKEFTFSASDLSVLQTGEEVDVQKIYEYAQSLSSKDDISSKIIKFIKNNYSEPETTKDNLGRITKEKMADGSIYIYTYDGDTTNVKQETLRNSSGQTVSSKKYSYDGTKLSGYQMMAYEYSGKNVSKITMDSYDEQNKFTGQRITSYSYNNKNVKTSATTIGYAADKKTQNMENVVYYDATDGSVTSSKTYTFDKKGVKTGYTDKTYESYPQDEKTVKTYKISNGKTTLATTKEVEYSNGKKISEKTYNGNNPKNLVMTIDYLQNTENFAVAETTDLDTSGCAILKKKYENGKLKSESVYKDEKATELQETRIYAYKANGNPVSVTTKNANQQTTGVKTYCYDSSTGVLADCKEVLYEYNSSNKITGSTTRTYNNKGLVESEEVKTLDGKNNVTGKTKIEYQYKNGLLTASFETKYKGKNLLEIDNIEKTTYENGVEKSTSKINLSTGIYQKLDEATAKIISNNNLSDPYKQYFKEAMEYLKYGYATASDTTVVSKDTNSTAARLNKTYFETMINYMVNCKNSIKINIAGSGSGCYSSGNTITLDSSRTKSGAVFLHELSHCMLRNKGWDEKDESTACLVEQEFANYQNGTELARTVSSYVKSAKESYAGLYSFTSYLSKFCAA